MMDRRSFIKLLLAAPAAKCIDIVSPDKNEAKLPEAILVDPYLVSMKDLENACLPGKVIRLRRPAWGRGEPITRIF